MTARSTSCAQEAWLKGDGDELDTASTEDVALRVASVDADDEGLAEKETLPPAAGTEALCDTDAVIVGDTDRLTVFDGDTDGVTEGDGVAVALPRFAMLGETVGDIV